MTSDTNDVTRSSALSAFLPRPLPIILAIYAAYNVAAPIAMAFAHHEAFAIEHEIVIVLQRKAHCAAQGGRRKSGAPDY